MKTKNKNILWKLLLTTIVKDKEIKKEFEGIASSKEELLQPIETLESAIKVKTTEINLKTNYKFIFEYLKKYNGPLKIIPSLDKELVLDISDMENYARENLKDIPEFLKIRLREIKEEGFEKNLKISMILFRAYLYFKEKPEETFEIPLIKDLKKENEIKEDLLIEDIFIKIEESFQ
jgi:hypothetical protein